MFQFERQKMDSFLKSLNYPIAKDQLIERARQAGLPSSLFQLFERLEGDRFDNADAVEDSLAAKKAY